MSVSLSTWLDIGVVLVALLFAVSGWRRGAIAGALAFFGVVLGAVAGILIAPHVLVHISESRWRAVVGIGLIILLVIVGEMAGMVLGSAARGVMRSPSARTLDSSIGALLHVIGVLIAAWLLAVPLTSSSQPQIAAAVSGSQVLGDVDRVAPSWLRSLPREFAGLLNTSGLPNVIEPFAHMPSVPVDPPDPNVIQTAVPTELQRSVLRIHGMAPSCQRALVGSGFVVSPEHVVTNAHVVAGTSSVSVDSAQGSLKAQVVLFNPDVDIAVLDVPGLNAPSIPLSAKPAGTGDSAIILGYPGGLSYTAGAARVRTVWQFPAPNIYNDDTVTRQVYTVRGTVRAGNSGGPLVDPQGNVLGVVFGVDRANPDTGFALTLKEIQPQLEAAPTAFAPVETGTCVLG
jgi:S1-C subfamily serine protease